MTLKAFPFLRIQDRQREEDLHNDPAQVAHAVGDPEIVDPVLVDVRPFLAGRRVAGPLSVYGPRAGWVNSYEPLVVRVIIHLLLCIRV